ncbi:MAG: DUF5681 domain-containing protein [Alphaproteobacteria bacterium]
MSNRDGKNEGGFGKPPVHSRYKKGQSGNPQGRRRETMTIEKLAEKILNEKVTIGGKTMIWGEAILRGAVARAARDTRAAKFVLSMVGDNRASSSGRDEISEEDHAILEDYVRWKTATEKKSK